jgi:hypothetical protein
MKSNMLLKAATVLNLNGTETLPLPSILKALFEQALPEAVFVKLNKDYNAALECGDLKNNDFFKKQLSGRIPLFTCLTFIPQNYLSGTIGLLFENSK